MIKDWLEAFRLRTLPLALASVMMGGIVAEHFGGLKPFVFVMTILTTIFLQVLSNLANDYGDTVNGADHEGRKGPSRAVQQGKISLLAMKKAILVFVVLSLVSGVFLLLLAFSLEDLKYLLTFFLLGILAIAAAIKYTAGSKPYGYAGLGDISVLVFFGVVGVVGAAFLHIKSFNILMLLPGVSIGAFATGVLNINNIRDIESDQAAGKKSIPVRIGERNAKRYHIGLIFIGWVSMLSFTLLTDTALVSWSYLLSLPLFVFNAVKVYTLPKEKLDPFLKQMALSTLLFVILNLFSFL